MGVSAALIAAPPAFWWIGLTRLPVGFGALHGSLSGSGVAGLALAPSRYLLVLAAAREIPSNAYEAARVSLAPTRRFVFVLFPLLRPALLAGFLLTGILLIGESEIPFLFGFRTSMTDVVTTFSQTFDAGRALPAILPLVVTVLVLGLLMVRPLFAVMLPAARAAGEAWFGNTRASSLPSVMFGLPALAALSLGGYAWAAMSGAAGVWRRLESTCRRWPSRSPSRCSARLTAVGLTVLAAYPARGDRLIRPLAMIGVLLFCVPAAVVAIGWIAIGQSLGGITIPPAVAYVSRTIGLPVLGFLTAYSRVAAILGGCRAARAAVVNPSSVDADVAAPGALARGHGGVDGRLDLRGQGRRVATLGARGVAADVELVPAVCQRAVGGHRCQRAHRIRGGRGRGCLAAAGPAVLWRGGVDNLVMRDLHVEREGRAVLDGCRLNFRLGAERCFGGGAAPASRRS